MRSPSFSFARDKNNALRRLLNSFTVFRDKFF